MKISRAEYERLIQRIEDLEARPIQPLVIQPYPFLPSGSTSIGPPQQGFNWCSSRIEVAA